MSLQEDYKAIDAKHKNKPKKRKKLLTQRIAKILIFIGSIVMISGIITPLIIFL